MKLFIKTIFIASIMISSLWIASMFTNIPLHSGESKPLRDDIVVKISYDRVEAARILIYGSNLYEKHIETLYIVKLRIKQNPSLSSIVERLSFEIYSAKVKPLFNTYSVMREDSFREGVLDVLDRTGVLINRQVISRDEEEITVESREQYLVVIVRYVLKNVEIDLSSYVPSAIYYGRGTLWKNNLYDHVYRAINNSFYSILLNYFVENAVVKNSPISFKYYVYMSKGSLSYSGITLSWIITIIMSIIQPNLVKQSLYKLGISVRNLREILRRLKLSILLSKTPSPRHDKRS